MSGATTEPEQNSQRVSKATHSTWCVIGKTYMTLSVSAIVCDWLRSGCETGL